MALNRCKNGHMYSARKYGDTCPYCNTEIERVNLYSNTGRRTMIDDPDKTMPIMGTEENADPVTGWLVCIEGTQYGKDYKIHSGKNSEEQTICIFRFLEIMQFQESIMQQSFMMQKIVLPICCREIHQDLHITTERLYIRRWNCRHFL